MAVCPAHVLIPGTCKDADLHGKRDFADVTKLRILKWEDYPGLSGEPDVIKGSLGEGDWRIRVRESDAAMEAQTGAT